MSVDPYILFGIPVWESKIELEEDDRSSLVDYFTSQSETLQGNPTYEAGGWESEMLSHTFTNIPSPQSKLFQKVYDYTKKIVREGYSNKQELKFYGYVIRVNKGEEYVKKHIRSNKSLFTSTYFLTAPDSDALLTFYHGYPHIVPFMETLDAIDYNLTYPVIHYEPKVGKIFTYPSWLPVSVLPGHSEKNRITIDFYFRT